MVLIIGGHSRSGTTLLQHLCNGHPDITMTNEFGNFLYLGKPGKEYIRLMLKRLWDKGILENRLLLSSGVNKRGMKGINILRAHTFAAHYLLKMYKRRGELINVSAVEETLQSIFPKTRIAGDKHPSYVFLLDKLAGESRLLRLVIYRDCRDVASSTLEKARTTWRNMPWVKDFDTAEKVARQWMRSIELMERHVEKLHVIRYEDLIYRPEREIEALARWLGADPAGFRKEIIRDTSIGKYKSRLSDEELATVMEIAGPTMARLGYI